MGLGLNSGVQLLGGPGRAGKSFSHPEPRRLTCATRSTCPRRFVGGLNEISDTEQLLVLAQCLVHIRNIALSYGGVCQP